MAFLLIHTWMLATGRILRSDVPPAQLSEDELIAFWADDHIAGAAREPFARRRNQRAGNGAAGRSPAAPLDGQVCGMLAVDIAGFTGPERDDDIQRYLHESLYSMLKSAFDGSGLPWHDCIDEDRGDGALVVVPPTLAAAGLVDPLPERLRGLIRRHNRVSCEAARIQLRVAIHIGPVHHDGDGFVGGDVNLLFRLLDAPPLKRMLAGSGAELALIASDCVYQNVVRRHPSLVDPAAFQRLTVRVRQTRVHAWAHVSAAAPQGGNTSHAPRRGPEA